MKNLYKILSLVLVLVITFVSCEKEAIIINAFEFEISEAHEESATINYPQLTAVNIISDSEFAAGDYYFSYEILEGTGKFIVNGNDLEENTENKLSEATSSVFFVGSTLGINKVRISVNNSGEVVKKLELIYDVKHNPYVLEMTSTVTEYNVDEFVPVKVNLLNTGIDQSVTYKRTFFLLEGEGELYTEDETVVIPLEEELPINVGETNYNLKFSTFTEAKFLIKTEDSNGQIKEATLVFNGLKPGLDFTVAFNPSTIFENQDFNFDFVIPEVDGLGGQNTMRYVINEGDVIVTDIDDSAIIEDTPKEVSLFGNFSWKGKVSTAQNIEITFILENSEAIPSLVSKTISIEVVSGDFSFSVTPNDTGGLVNSPINLIAQISENGTSGAPYKLSYSSDKSGVLDYNGILYTTDTDIENVGVPNLTFPLVYRGLEDGIHTLTFTLFNSFGILVNTQIITISLTTSTGGFTFDAEKDTAVGTTAFRGDCSEINFVINGPVNEEYSVSFAAGVAGKFVYGPNAIEYGPGEPFILSDSDFSGCFRGEALGEANLIFTVVSNGVTLADSTPVIIEIIDKAAISVEQPDPSDFPVNTAVDLNTIINENVASGSPYKIKFESNSDGFITYNGIVYTSGEKIEGITDVNVTFPLFYTGTTIGEHELIFTLEDDLGEVFNTETIVLNFTEADPVDFTFNATADTTQDNTPDNTVIINTCTPINLDLTGPVNGEYRLKWAAAVSGFFTYEGVDYNEADLGLGILIDINNIDANACFTATSSGVSELKLSVTYQSDTKFKLFDFEVLRPAELVTPFSETDGEVGNDVGLVMSILETPAGSNAGPYKVKFETDKNGKLLYLGDNTNNDSGAIITLNAEDQIDLGFIFAYNVFEAGLHTLTFTLIGPGDVEYDTKTIKINYSSDPAAELIVPTGPLTVDNVGGSIDLDLSILESTPNSGPYGIKFVSDMASSIIYGPNVYNNEGNIELNADDQIDLEFTFKYFGDLESGRHKVNFTLLDDSEMPIGEVKTIFIDFITTNNYTFNAETVTTNQTTAIINACTDIKFGFEGSDPSDLFQLKWNTIGQGTFRLEGNPDNMPADTFVDVNPIDLIGCFTGTQLGESNLTFTVRRTGETEEQSSIVQLLIIDGNISFDVKTSNNTDEITVDAGSPTSLNAIITENGTSQGPYKILIDDNGIEENTIFLAGVSLGTLPVEIDVDPTVLNPFYSYISIEGGANVLDFKLLNDIGEVIGDKQVTVNVNTPEFNLTAVSPSTVFINEQAQVNINLNNGSDAVLYRAKWNSAKLSECSIVTIGDVPKNEEFIFFGNEFEALYKGLELGVTELEFTVSDGNFTETIDIDLTIIDKPTLSLENISVIDFPVVNDELTFRTRIIEAGDSAAPYSLKIESDNNGNIIYNGAPFGTSHTINDISNLDFNVNYVGLAEGEHNLKFTLIKEGAELDVKTISVTYALAGFQYDLSTDPEGPISKAFGEEVNFNLIYDTNSTQNLNAKLSYSIVNSIGIPSGGIVNQLTNTSLPQDYDLGTGSTIPLRLSYTRPETFTITWNYTNDLGFSDTYTTTITIEEPVDYSFNAIGSLTNQYNGYPTNIDLIINGPNNLQYRGVFSDALSGQISIDGVFYNAGDEFILSAGTKTVEYIGNRLGDSGLKFVVQVDGGQQKEAEIDLTIEEFSSNLNIFPDTSNTTTVGNPITLFVSYDQTIETNVGAKLSYSIVSPVGGDIAELRREDDGMILDSPSSLDINSIMELSMSNLSKGEYVINWTYENLISSVETYSTTIVVEEPFDFDFDLTETPPLIALKDTNIPIKLKIDGPSNVEYKMKWEAAVAGSFLYDLVAYNTGETFTVPTGDFVGFFKGLAPGVSNLKLSVEAQGVVKTIDINLTIEEFSFMLDIPDEIIVFGDASPVNFVINYNPSSTDNVSARLSYTIPSRTRIVRRDNNDTLDNPYELPSGDTDLFFESVSTENEQITWVYENNIGMTQTYITNVVFQNRIDFKLSTNSINTDVTTNVDFSASIIENGASLAPYRLDVRSLTPNKSSIFYFNGSSEDLPNSFNGITDLSLPFSYDAVEGGLHSLVFRLFGSDGTPIGEEQTIEMNISTFPYTFEAVRLSPQTLLVGETAQVELDIVGDVTFSVAYKTKWSASIDGDFIKQSSGDVVMEGEEFILADGNSVMEFTGNSPGVSNLTFTITDGNVTKTATVDLKFVNSFLEIIPQGNTTANVGEKIPLQAKVNGDYSNGTIYRLTVISDKIGEFYYNGILQRLPFRIENIMDVASSDITFEYAGLDLGEHELTFSLTNNLGVEVANEKQILNYNATTDYGLSIIAPPGGGQVNQAIPLLVSIDEGPNPSSGPYTIEFNSLSFGATIKYEGVTYTNGSEIPIVPNQVITEFEFFGSDSGLYRISFILKDRLGEELARELVTIEVFD